MTKKQLNQLVLYSYDNKVLNPKKVEAIAKTLKRRELKQYIKALKNWENKISVGVFLPYLPKQKEEKMLKKLFPDKKLVYNLDPSLILGLKIIDNDNVYETSLKDNFNRLLSHLGGEND